MQSSFFELTDIVEEANYLAEKIEYNPTRIEVINERINEIYGLQQKHSVSTVRELIDLRELFDSKINTIVAYDEEINKLDLAYSEQIKRLNIKASELSKLRKSSFKRIEKSVVTDLQLLGMNKSKLAITHNKLPDFGIKDIRPTLDTLLSHRVDGIIWAVPEVGENRTCFHDEVVTPKIPAIFLTMSESAHLSTVKINNFKSAKAITVHLIEQGCQHVGHITGPLNWWEVRQRKAGWEAAQKEVSREVMEDMWSEGNWSSRSGDTAFRELLEKFPQMDGVFVGNDQMALSVLQIAHQSGIRIPQELAVAGFDGILIAAKSAIDKGKIIVWPGVIWLNSGGLLTSF